VPGTAHDSVGEPETAERIARARTVTGDPAEAPLAPESSVGEVLAERTAQDPARPFLVYRDDDLGVRRVHSWGEFSGRVQRLARWMRDALGVRPGDRVATLHHNHDDTAAIYFATWRLGACACPVNVGEDDARVRFVLENSEAVALFVHPDYAARAAAVSDGLPALRHRVACGGTPPPGFRALAEADAASDDPAALPRPTRDTEALIVYTSGTTGPPKGVVLDQGNLLADARAIARWQRIGPGTRTMCVLPVHHVNGIVVTLLTPLYAGSSTVLNRKFSPRAFWRRAEEEGVHVASVVPTLLQFLLDAGEDTGKRNLRLLRHIVCGAGPLTCDLAAEFEDRFRVPILHGYGLSETTCYSCFLPPDMTPAEHREALTARGFPSIGCAVEANAMAIHDPAGTPLAEGERGEIVVRGQNVMRHYFRRPDANRDTFAHGWFRSGDEGFWRRDGEGRVHYFITGRIKELIVRGGVKISPFELDEVLMNVPGVKAGLAVGFENRYYGEEVGAYVVPEPSATVTEEQVLAACRARFPAFKVPKVVVFGTEVPVTSTGKYQRGRLKPLFEKWKGRQLRTGDDPSPRVPGGRLGG